MYEYNGQIVKVVDGDTVDVILDLGLNIKHKIRLRLSRINTPEIFGVLKDSVEYQKGLASKRFVEDFAKLTNNNVRISTIKDKTEKYGRYLAEIYALEGPFKDKNLSNEMYDSGFATLYVSAHDEIV